MVPLVCRNSSFFFVIALVVFQEGDDRLAIYARTGINADEQRARTLAATQTVAHADSTSTADAAASKSAQSRFDAQALNGDVHSGTDGAISLVGVS